jgi:hypothetical protein
VQLRVGTQFALHKLREVKHHDPEKENQKAYTLGQED